MTSFDIRALPRRGNAIAALLLAAAWLAIPPTPPNTGTDVKAQVFQRILGPLRYPLASTLRLRAGFAREAGRPGESVRLQGLALDLDPRDTPAVVWLAGEIATQIPLSGLTKLDNAACAKAGIDVLRRARALGNADPRLLDWEAFLWVERYAPTGSKAEDRRVALDNAIAACEATEASWIPANARAAILLEERAALLEAQGQFAAAADDYARAAQHERLLADRGAEGSASRAEALESRAESAASRPPR